MIDQADDDRSRRARANLGREPRLLRAVRAGARIASIERQPCRARRRAAAARRDVDLSPARAPTRTRPHPHPEGPAERSLADARRRAGAVLGDELGPAPRSIDFHGFHHDCRVLGDEVPAELTASARLWLVEGDADRTRASGSPCSAHARRSGCDPCRPHPRRRRGAGSGNGSDDDPDPAAEVAPAERRAGPIAPHASRSPPRSRSPTGGCVRGRRRPRRARRGKARERRCSSTTETHLQARCREAVPPAFGPGVAYAEKAFLCKVMARLARRRGTAARRGDRGGTSWRWRSRARRRTLRARDARQQQVPIRAARHRLLARRAPIVVIDSADEIDRIVIRALPADEAWLERSAPGPPPGHPRRREAHTHEFVTTGTEDTKFGFSIASSAADAAVEAIQADPTASTLVGVHARIGSRDLPPRPAFELKVAALAPLIAAART